MITEAWVRVQERPADRRAATIRFPDYFAGARAVRDILQSGLRPANCRVVDAREAALTFAGDGSAALLLLAFEDDLDDQFLKALKLAGGEAEVKGNELRAPGATPSCARPTCATPSSASASSARRSRRRSPGTATTRSSRTSAAPPRPCCASAAAPGR